MFCSGTRGMLAPLSCYQPAGSREPRASCVLFSCAMISRETTWLWRLRLAFQGGGLSVQGTAQASGLGWGKEERGKGGAVSGLAT